MSQPQDCKRLSSGMAGLDLILGGGLPERRLHLIEGTPGSGKTTLALQFLLDGVNRGEAGLYVTLSETKEEINSVAASHGWSLSKLAIHELAVSDDALMPDGQYTFFHPSEVELGETTKSVLEEVERAKPKRVVFDSLSEMRLLAREPLRYRRQILGLKQYFAGRDCTVLLLDDLTSEVGDLQLQSLAHGVILLEQLSPEYGAERRRLRVLKMRGVRFLGGYHDYRIATGGLDIFPRLCVNETDAHTEPEIVSSGVQGLDALLCGGADRGTNTLIMGPAGSGKSTLGLMFAIEAAKRGENSALFLFDETLATLHSRCCSIGIELKKYIDAGNIKITFVDPAALSPGEFTHRVKTAVEVQDTKLVMIDSLNGYMNAMTEERFLTVHLHELFSYLNQKRVVSLLVAAQHGLFGQVQSPLDISYLSDTVILTRFFEHLGSVKKAVSVLKKRSGRHEEAIRELKISAKGIEVGQSLTDFQGVLGGQPIYIGKAASLMGE